MSRIPAWAARLMLLAAAMTSGPVQAEPASRSAEAGAAGEAERTRARDLYQQGQALFERKDYAGAARAFREGYALAPRPLFLFNIAQAYRLQGDCARAHELYQAYLRAAPQARNRAVVEKHLASTAHCAPAASQGSASGSASAAGASSRPVAAAPVSPVEAPAPASMAAGQAAPPASAASAGRLGGRKLLSLGLLGVGGAALGLSVVFALDAASASEEVEEAFASGARWDERLAEVERRGRRSETRSLILAGASLGLFAGGALLFHLDSRRGERRTVGLDLGLWRGGAVAGLRWTPWP